MKGYINLYKKNKGTDTDYVCDITKTLDSYLYHINKETGYINYIFIFGEDLKYGRDWLPIRIPGRTTGGILVENGVIREICIEEDLIGEGCYYKEGVQEALAQYLGQHLVYAKYETLELFESLLTKYGIHYEKVETIGKNGDCSPVIKLKGKEYPLTDEFWKVLFNLEEVQEDES